MNNQKGYATCRVTAIAAAITFAVGAWSWVGGSAGTTSASNGDSAAGHPTIAETFPIAQAGFAAGRHVDGS